MPAMDDVCGTHVVMEWRIALWEDAGARHLNVELAVWKTAIEECLRL